MFFRPMNGCTFSWETHVMLGLTFRAPRGIVPACCGLMALVLAAQAYSAPPADAPTLVERKAAMKRLKEEYSLDRVGKEHIEVDAKDVSGMATPLTQRCADPDENPSRRCFRASRSFGNAWPHAGPRLCDGQPLAAACGRGTRAPTPQGLSADRRERVARGTARAPPDGLRNAPGR